MIDNAEEIIKRIKVLEERVRHLEALENSMANNRGWDGTAWRKDPIRIGYSGDKTQEVTATASAGANTLQGDVVPDGEIWVVQAIIARDQTSAPSVVSLGARVNGIDIYTKRQATVAANEFVVWSEGEIILSPGDRVIATIGGATDGDILVMRYHAVRVDIDQ
jgi:hypothetical protein